MRQKKLERYPLAYWTLFREANEKGETYIDCEDHDQAVRIREDLYLFRKAIRQAAEAAPTSERLILLRARADRLTFSIRNSEIKIHV